MTKKWPLLFCFKKHLLGNYLAKFNENVQEASLHDPLKMQQRNEIDNHQQKQNGRLVNLQ